MKNNIGQTEMWTLKYILLVSKCVTMPLNFLNKTLNKIITEQVEKITWIHSEEEKYEKNASKKSTRWSTENDVHMEW